ncbi:MAG: hypothetical protein HS109_08150 [Burkholderiales bacterium]|nr:hypothetical protein [Burkholderiales bacterium]MBE7522008.1 hypothetical protein [Burkholderiales bacterium]MBE7522343.1 hypothetical protein [Burkholderiales bacterium]MBZ0172304.1 hypothetical protein [Phycisphaerales bacterium]
MTKSSPPSKRSLATQARRSRQRIEKIRAAVGTIDYLCTGTLYEHLSRCGKAGCRCATDLAARHGPYYDWGYMQDGKLVRRRLSAEQARLMRLAIANYRKLKKLLREWERESARLIEAEQPRDH